MKDTNRPSVIIDENHHIRSVRLSSWNQRFQAVISKKPLNWAVLIKFALAGAVAGFILAWIF